MKAIPAIKFSVAVGMNRVMVEPNNTARSVETTRALAAAPKTRRGRTVWSVAYNIVAIWVLSPSSANNTDPNITSTVFTQASFRDSINSPEPEFSDDSLGIHKIEKGFQQSRFYRESRIQEGLMNFQDSVLVPVRTAATIVDEIEEVYD